MKMAEIRAGEEYAVAGRSWQAISRVKVLAVEMVGMRVYSSFSTRTVPTKMVRVKVLKGTYGLPSGNFAEGERAKLGKGEEFAPARHFRHTWEKQRAMEADAIERQRLADERKAAAAAVFARREQRAAVFGVTIEEGHYGVVEMSGEELDKLLDAAEGKR